MADLWSQRHEGGLQRWRGPGCSTRRDLPCLGRNLNEFVIASSRQLEKCAVSGYETVIRPLRMRWGQVTDDVNVAAGATDLRGSRRRREGPIIDEDLEEALLEGVDLKAVSNVCATQTRLTKDWTPGLSYGSDSPPRRALYCQRRPLRRRVPPPARTSLTRYRGKGGVDHLVWCRDTKTCLAIYEGLELMLDGHPLTGRSHHKQHAQRLTQHVGRSIGGRWKARSELPQTVDAPRQQERLSF